MTVSFQEFLDTSEKFIKVGSTLEITEVFSQSEIRRIMVSLPHCSKLPLVYIAGNNRFIVENVLEVNKTPNKLLINLIENEVPANTVSGGAIAGATPNDVPVHKYRKKKISVLSRTDNNNERT